MIDNSFLNIVFNIEGNEYKIGDTVEHSYYGKGFVAFGKFEAEIYTCYGLYVVDITGNQLSEAGLTTAWKVINNKQDIF